DVAELKRRADLIEIWHRLGGGPLRRGRGQAFWRNGNGYSVSLDPEKQLWHDFATGDGGDVIALVQTIRKCGFLEAAEWLANHTGVRVSKWIQRDAHADNNWATDLRTATWWRMSAEALAEHALQSLDPVHPERRDLTALLATIQLSDAALVNEYRQW